MFRRRPLPVVSRAAALLFGLAIALVSAPLLMPVFPFGDELKVGAAAPRTIEATESVTYASNALTAAARDQAAADVPGVFLPPDSAVSQQRASALKAFLEEVRAIRMRPGLSSQEQVVQIGALASGSGLAAAGRTSLVAIERSEFDAFVTRAASALEGIMKAGVKDSEIEARVDQFLATPANAPASTAEQTALRELMRAFVAPNVRLDEEATRRARDEARAATALVYQTYAVGQVIVAEGQALSEADIEALQAAGLIETGIDWYDVAGGGLFALGAGLLLAIFVFQLQPFPTPAGRRMAVTVLTAAVVLLAVRFLLLEVGPGRGDHYLVFAIPVAAVAMVTASFADLSFAALVAVVTGLLATFIGITAPDLAGATFTGPIEALELAIAYTAGGLLGAVTVYRAERLSRFAFSAVAVSGATWVVLAAFWMLGEMRAVEDLGWLSLAAGINGAASAVLAVGVFVLLSMALGVTTRLQLMELVRADHPLLLRLQEEAPGTYHHSMMVSALAERAATRIGADALVVRAGSHYHDIGKLAQPRYYIENSLDGLASPHTDLPPAESARLIREHVTNGLEIARRYRVPQVVRDFIPQHHGTRLVTYFYRRAIQDGDDVSASDFRYAGPLPQSKEAAIVMLSDSCEAVIRARQERAQSHIDEVVDSVIAERLAEGQLDECDITMKEIQQVAASFKATLRAVYHPRIEYPAATVDEVAVIARLAEDPGASRSQSVETV
ncbi:MAG: HDIG domain-containing protein [Dehalococcoidia bacterium]|nr:HDIG domain-containing protein [Dehalococcoidia bacterium]NUQ54586.1 HDIG domain-containing protein [Dehalococcoidia bacterium]RIL03719.1 MAG: hypothetical protein DCC78_02910 [bacterium]